MTFPQVRLGNFVCVVGGYAFKSDDFSEYGLPIIKITNISNGTIDLNNLARIPQEKLRQGKSYTINTGDILIAMSGATTGKIGLVPKLENPLYQNQRVGNLKIIDNSKVYKPYIRLIMQSPIVQKQINNSAFGAAQPNISSSQIEDILIPIPSYEEQRKIATILVKVDSLRQKRKIANKKLMKLLQSVFLEMFGDPVTNPKKWEEINLGEISEVQGGLQLTPKRNDFPVKAPYLRVANVYRNKVTI